MPAAGGRRGGRQTINYWPGFVDALSTLLLAIVFLISVFMLGQFFLAREISSRDTVLDRLNRQISELTDLLALERSSRRGVEDNLSNVQTTLRTVEDERARLQSMVESGGAVQSRAQELNSALDAEKQATGRALSQVELLNQQIAAMRRQLAALEEALNTSEARDKESQARIADLGSRLNIALAQRVQELARYRSDFFGRLRQILGNRPDIRVVGDRFVFQSEVLFPAGQAVLRPEASGEIDRIASALSRTRKADPAGHPVDHAGRRAYGRKADPDLPVPVELGFVLRPRHRFRSGADQPGRSAPAARRDRVRRVPAPRPRHDRRRLCPQPAHRAETDGALEAGPIPPPRPGHPCR